MKSISLKLFARLIRFCHLCEDQLLESRDVQVSVIAKRRKQSPFLQ